MKIAMTSNLSKVIVPSSSNPTPIHQPQPHRSDVFSDDRTKALLGLGLLEINQLEGAAIPDFDFGSVDFHGIASGDSEGSPRQ